ncbi:unnamed protein product [Dovyalis caffra]|uniref:TF-B3 domain-containing protein n=1 Tax=Dovyalis caffra TaxID=77055 RepID=A0AAV1QRY7_9ROSI|nr:unnamed protein product [Dovyalis caffra]
MGKQPVRMKAVVYALSPFQQRVMSGLWKDLPGKIHHKVSENWISATLLLAPLVGVYTYVQNYQEKEKLEHSQSVGKVTRARSVTTNGNTYEEARKLRVEENKKRIEVQQHLPKPENSKQFELRRSSRARNPVSYLDDERAKKAAVEFQSSLQPEKPSFVKQMLQSHVYQGYQSMWLHIALNPRAFLLCFAKNHLPKEDLEVILEDENGSESGSKFLGEKAGLSAGWRGFALAHKLNAGDALVFELVEQWQFKVYTFRASASRPGEKCIDTVDREGSAGLKNGSKGGKKLHSNSVVAQKEKGTQMMGTTNIGTSVEEEHDKKDKSAGSEKPKFEDKDQCVVEPRKKRAERLFKKRVRV